MLPVHSYSNYFTLKDSEAGTLQPALTAWIPDHQNLHRPHKALPALPCTACVQTCKRRVENRRMHSEQCLSHGLNPPQRANRTNQGGCCRWWVLPISLQWVSPAKWKVVVNPGGTYDLRARALTASATKYFTRSCVRPQSHDGDDQDLIMCRAACTVALYNR